VEAHNTWIASEANRDLLTYFEPLVTIDGFAHVAIDFAQFPTEAQMSICRKCSSDDQLGTEGGHIKNQGGTWAGKERGEEKPTDNYRLAAFEALQSNLDESDLINIEHIHINNAEVYR